MSHRWAFFYYVRLTFYVKNIQQYVLTLSLVPNMGLNHNGERMGFSTEEALKYPTIPQNNIIYVLFRGLVLTPESIRPLNAFLEKKKFDKYDESHFDNIRVNLKETYEKTWFIKMDTDIVIEIIDKLYDYYAKYKDSLLDNIDKISTEAFELDYKLASINASRKAEEYLIEMLQMKHVLGHWVEDDEFYDNQRQRLEWLILDYFWDFERESKYLNDLEEECRGNSIKIDQLLQKIDWNDNLSELSSLKAEIEDLKYQNVMIKKIKIPVAKQCISGLKDEICRLAKWSEIVLSNELLSKLGKYPEFSELLIENDKKISPIELE